MGVGISLLATTFAKRRWGVNERPYQLCVKCMQLLLCGAISCSREGGCIDKVSSHRVHWAAFKHTHTHTHTHIHTRTHIRTHTHGHTHTHTRLRPSLFLYVVVKYLPSARKPTKAQARRSNSTCVTRALKYVCIACTTAACASAASMCSCPSAEEHIAVSAPRATAWQSSKQRVNACACACVCVGG